MPMIAKAGEGKEFVQLEPGTYPAVCTDIIDLGTQDKEYQGEAYSIREIAMFFEFPTETEVFDEEKGEEPHVLTKYFSLSLGAKANLTKFLVGWRGKAFTEEEKAGFDMKNILGQACLLSVVDYVKSDKSHKSVIDSASKLMKGMEVPKPSRDLRYFAIDEFDQEIFDSLPKRTQETIMKSHEYQAAIAPRGVNASVKKVEDTSGKLASEATEDELPF